MSHPIEFNGTIPEEMIPLEVKKTFPPGITVDMLKVRLKNGGEVLFENATTELKGGGYTMNTFTFWACDVLTLRNSKVVTNGNDLIIFCNKLICDGAEIVAFEGDNKKASNGVGHSGVNGNHGAPGDSGGTVSVHVIDSMEGRLKINLSGQDGGHGEAGNDGAHGSKGARGSAAKIGVCFNWTGPLPCCKQQGGKGGTGSAGSPGGNGGKGGNAGHGGTLHIYNVGSSPIPEAAYEFTSDPGSPGMGGDPGKGGQGGDGGDGGEGNLLCHGGPHGDRGSRGSDGSHLGNGTVGGSGNKIIKNLPLEVILKND